MDVDKARSFKNYKKPVQVYTIKVHTIIGVFKKNEANTYKYTSPIFCGEASPTFGHANANFSVFIDRIRNKFLKK